MRLGAGLDADGMLTEEAAQRGLACLRRFATRLAGFAPSQVRAVATQTLREARNRNAFLLRAQEALGHPIEVISGREEARLIYAGVAHLQPSEDAAAGGRHRRPLHRDDPGPGPHAARWRSRSSVGCVSLSMRFFADGRITARRLPRRPGGRRRRVRGRRCSPSRPSCWRQALGSSGTAGAVSQLLQASGVTDGRITPGGAALVHRALPGRRARRPHRPARPEARAPRRAARRAGHPVHAGGALRHPRAVAGQGRAAPGRDRRPARAPAGPAAHPAAATCATPRCANCSGASASTPRRPRAWPRWRWRCSTARCPTPTPRRGASWPGPARCTRSA